jgi:hypothetical protein
MAETITDEMLAAGNDALADYWVALTTSTCGLTLFPDVVEAIYRAMEDAKARSQPQILADSA